MSATPLTGIRVLDLTTVIQGPMCASFLAQMGAEVIKVESRQYLDFTRSAAPFADEIKGINRAGLFNLLNRDKKSCTINLTKPEGIVLVKRLVEISDVVLENFTTKALKRFGLDYVNLCDVKPEIIVVSASGFGRVGPEKDYLAYGRNLHAASGLTALIGYPQGPPLGLTGQWADVISGYTMAFAAMVCLYNRLRTGQGQHVDLAMNAAVAAQLSEPMMDYIMNHRSWERTGNRSDFAAPHNCFRCKGEDRWVSIAVEADEQWQSMKRAMGNPAWADDEKFRDGLARWQNQEELDKAIQSWTSSQSDYEVMQKLQERGVPAGITLNTADLSEDPHLQMRRYFPTVEHPEIGKIRAIKLPWRISGLLNSDESRSPLFGEHNDYVFHDLLHLSDTEIEELIRQKVID